jgi:3-methyl-2-oxobutanoate hydroxymethyltransferase
LVLHDLLGMFDRFTPRFVKRYANLFEQMGQALAEYREDVAARRFPAEEHVFTVDEATWHEWLADMKAAEPEPALP